MIHLLFSYLQKTHIWYIIIFFLTFTFFFDITTFGDQQFSYLANSFLQGKLYFTQMPYSWGDSAPFGGHYYWPLGPFPAMLLLPFVYLSRYFPLFFNHGYIAFLFVVGVLGLCYRLARKTGFNRTDSAYLAFAFCFASVYMGIAFMPHAWYFSHSIVAFFLLASLVEYLGKRRYWRIGLYMTAVLMTRISASLGIVFYLACVLLLVREKVYKKILHCSSLLVPILCGLVFLGLYNFARFGEIFEQGYSYQLLNSALVAARNYGTLNPIHIAGNLYYFLLSMPLPVFRDEISHVLVFPFVRPDYWGMSAFVTSPYYLYLFFLSCRDKLSAILIGTSIVVAIPVFLYYGIGLIQFGYRYSLDFLPYIFFLFIRNYHHKYSSLSKNMKGLILFSALTNFYLFLTMLTK